MDQEEVIKPTHRQVIKAWMADIFLEHMRVADWGSGSKPASRYIAHADCEFTTIDNNPLIAEDRRSPSHLHWDITQPVEIDKFDAAFCIEVLEHVENPQAVLENIRANLQPGASLYLTVPFKLHIHSDADYWRFTDQGVKLLLSKSGFEVISVKDTIDELGYMAEAKAV